MTYWTGGDRNVLFRIAVVRIVTNVAMIVGINLHLLLMLLMKLLLLQFQPSRLINQPHQIDTSCMIGTGTSTDKTQVGTMVRANGTAQLGRGSSILDSDVVGIVDTDVAAIIVVDVAAVIAHAAGGGVTVDSAGTGGNSGEWMRREGQRRRK